MSAPISGVAGVRPIAVDPPSEASGKSEGLDFGKVLTDALGQASQAEKASTQLSERFAAGDPSVGIHESMIAAEKAAISVKYAVNLKNKLLEAYRELLNTPL